MATAAHCVHQAKLDQITVHLGEFDTKNTEAVTALRTFTNTEKFTMITVKPVYNDYLIQKKQKVKMITVKLVYIQ